MTEAWIGLILAINQSNPIGSVCLVATLFLAEARDIKLSDDTRLVWSRSHAAAHIGRAFLEAGALIEIEFCDASGRCHGHICVCPDPSTHSKLYECPEPHPRSKHKHEWISVKTPLSDHLGIPEAEPLQFEARNRSTRSISPADLLELARDTEAAWQRQVDACVRDGLPILTRWGVYSWNAEMVNEIH
ncbi:hypothetical protein Q7P36_010295 [Cladosporium allicinum]